MRKAEIIVIIIILVSIAVGIYLYPKMPERIASHWNAQGKVDGYMSKFWGLFIMPIISIGLFLFFIAIPRIDPLKTNIEKFRGYFDTFIVLFFAFLFYLYLLTIFWNIGLRFGMIQLLSPAFGILFYYGGILIENAKRNWFIGIRTPWTLSSDTVWEKTHKVGARLFKIVAVICLFGIFFPRSAIFFVLIPIILVVIYTIIYSYVKYQRETK